MLVSPAKCIFLLMLAANRQVTLHKKKCNFQPASPCALQIGIARHGKQNNGLRSPDVHALGILVRFHSSADRLRLFRVYVCQMCTCMYCMVCLCTVLCAHSLLSSDSDSNLSMSRSSVMEASSKERRMPSILEHRWTVLRTSEKVEKVRLGHRLHE